NRHLPAINGIYPEKERTDNHRRKEKEQTPERKESGTQNLDDVTCGNGHSEPSDNDYDWLEKRPVGIRKRIDEQPENDEQRPEQHARPQNGFGLAPARMNQQGNSAEDTQTQNHYAQQQLYVPQHVLHPFYMRLPKNA